VLFCSVTINNNASTFNYLELANVFSIIRERENTVYRGRSSCSGREAAVALK
jgi:hypothetical protein